MLVGPIRKKNTLVRRRLLVRGNMCPNPSSQPSSHLLLPANHKTSSSSIAGRPQLPETPISLIGGWNNRGSFPTLYQAALDKLAIPAMSVECERVFSSKK